jgi:hypothetical protein
MISNTLVQKALIARLKAAVNVTALLNGAAEIREGQWQGRSFVYPSIRVTIGVQTPRIEATPCDWSRVSFSILSFSEERSSFEADDIAGAVNSALHLAAWDTADNFRFHKVYSTGLVSSVRMTERVWRGQAFFVADLHTL